MRYNCSSIFDAIVNVHLLENIICFDTYSKFILNLTILFLRVPYDWLSLYVV